MEPAQIGAYVWARLPLLLLFANGYLVYRLLAVTGLTEAFVDWMLRKSRGSVPRLLGLLMASAAALSLFIPNAITMLTLLPVLTRLDRGFKAQGVALTTPLALAAIYGANIGGMGSLIGSPANLVLIGALDYLGVPGRERITFANWSLWAVPLALLLLAVAWLFLAGPGLGRGLRRARVDVGERGGARADLTPWQQAGLKLFWLFLVFWVGEALAAQLVPAFRTWEPAVCAGFFLWFGFLCFFQARTPCQGPSAPLLRLRDVVTGLPWRGLVFLGVIAAIIAAVNLLGLDARAARLLERAAVPGAGTLATVFFLALAVVFLTEGLSNTVVAAAFFPIAYQAATVSGLDPLTLMIAVSAASTCAFMTPVATPCNALAFGEMRGVSLARMLGLGLLLNLACAAIMAAWLSWAIPLIY